MQIIAEPAHSIHRAAEDPESPRAQPCLCVHTPSSGHLWALSVLYSTAQGLWGTFLLFIRFHFTPLNHKIITTAFPGPLWICDICLSVSVLPTQCSLVAIMDVLKEQFHLCLPRITAAMPAPALLTQQQAWRKALTQHRQESGFLSFYGEQEIRDVLSSQMRNRFKSHQNNRWGGEFPSSCLGFYLRRAVDGLL